MPETKTKPYKETLDKVLYEQEYSNTSENGTQYPSHRVRVEHISYNWEYKNNNWEIVPYEWEKIIIRNSKLTLNQWNVEVKKKVRWTYSVNDETVVKMSIEDFDNLLKWVSKN